MNSSLPSSSLHFIKNIPYQLKIFPVIVLFQISISSPKFLNALSIIVSIIILPLFPLYPPFSLHTANFTLLKLLSSAFKMISLSQLANTNFLLLYFLIFLPPSTLSIIIFFYLASLLTLVSLVLHFLSSHLVFPIALSLFPFNLTSLAFCSHLHWRPSGFSPWSSSLLSIYYASNLSFSNSPVSYHLYADDTQL